VVEVDAFAWVLVIAGVVLVAVALWAMNRSSQSRRLQRHFGPEYEREVERADGDRRQAEATLGDRVARWRRLELRPLSPAARDGYRERWEQVQAEFVDQPDAALGHAQALLDEVMTERGYPRDDSFETRVDLVSVGHPRVVEHYRVAHRLHHDNDATGDDAASTEERRQAVVHYRELFTELLDGGVPDRDRELDHEQEVR
jgi:hypothetical protein